MSFIKSLPVIKELYIYPLEQMPSFERNKLKQMDHNAKKKNRSLNNTSLFMLHVFYYSDHKNVQIQMTILIPLLKSHYGNFPISIYFVFKSYSSFLFRVIHGVLLNLGISMQHKEGEIRAQVADDEAQGGHPVFRDGHFILVVIDGSHGLLRELRRVHPRVDVQVRLPEFLPRRSRESVLGKIGADVAGHHVADANAEGFQLGADAVEDADKGMLGAAVRRAVGGGELSGLTGDADNVSALVFDHVRHHYLQVVVGTVHVDIVEADVVFEGVVDELASHRQSCVLHHQVDALALGLKTFDELLGHSAHLLEVGHVHGQHFSVLWMRAAGLHPLEFLSIAG